MATALHKPSETYTVQEWRKDGYLISTNHSLLNLEVINDAFDSEDVYWTTRMDPDQLRRMLDLSLCFGIYREPGLAEIGSIGVTGNGNVNHKDHGTSNPHPDIFTLFPILLSSPNLPQTNPTLSVSNPTPSTPNQIGFARLVTDTFSFAYLTDVFVLPAHRGQQLATWLMHCIHQTVTSWPDLRRVALFASGEHARRFYVQTMGMVPYKAGNGGHGHGHWGIGREGEATGDEIGVGEWGQDGDDGIEFLMLPLTQDVSGLELLVRDA